MLTTGYLNLNMNNLTDSKETQISAACLLLSVAEADEILESAIDHAIIKKPKGHDFVIERGRSGPAVARHMSVTGG